MRSGILRVSLLGWIVLSGTSSFGQETAAERHKLLVEFLKKKAAEISSRSLSDIQRLEEWKEKKPIIHRKFLSMLGLEPLPERTPLKLEVTGTLQRGAYRIEKTVFQSLPGLYVTGNLYVPNGLKGPLPAILYVCGHDPHPLGAKWEYQDRGRWFAEHGYVAFILDTLEFGEVPGIHHGIHDLNMWNWLSLGYTPAGVEVWNAMRAVDYLETRPEVDRGRIGMTGISGGGAVTWFTAAVDERIAAAAPICATYTFGSQAAHWTASGQCDCIFFHNTFEEDLPTVAALIAPRPLLICSGRKDRAFPPDGSHEVYRRAKRVYDLYAGGDSDRIKEVDEDAGHSDTPLFRKEARQWMNLWLTKDNNPLGIEPIPKEKTEAAQDLACLERLPREAVNYKIHDLFIPTAKPEPRRTLEEWRKRRQKLLGELGETVFRWFPRGKILFETRVTGNSGGWVARYADYKEVVFLSEPGMPVRAQLLQSRKSPKDAPVLVYVKRPGDSIYRLDWDELLPVLGRFTVLVLNPRGTEHPVSSFEHAEIERTASWIGRTLASMQVWDILRAVDWIHQEEKLSPSSLTVYGKGEMGILSLYAGVLDSRIGSVVLKDPPVTHRQGPALLNVLRITDVPEVAGAFAPRRLVFIGNIPGSLEDTHAIYELFERRNSITSAGSLPEALEIWKY